MSTPTIHPDLPDLLKALCDDTLSDEQMRRLEAILTDNPEAQRFYARFVLNHDLMRTTMQVEASPIPLEAPIVVVDAQFEYAAEQRRELEQRYEAEARAASVDARPTRLAWSPYGAIAAALLLAATLTIALWSGGDRTPVIEPPGAIATLGYAEQAVWDDATSPGIMQEGATLEAGPVRLDDGEAQVLFDSGAVVTLIGRVRMTLTGSNRCTLHEGRLLAFVPPSAKGFTVDTPEGAIIDHGTEFGVEVLAGGAGEQVHVFTGRVTFAHGKLNTPLSAGQAVLADDTQPDVVDSGALFVTAADPSMFPRLPRWQANSVDLIDRPRNDTTPGNIFVMNTPLGRSGVVTGWSFFDNDPNRAGASVTPLILALEPDGLWHVVGVGRTRVSDGSGEQAFDFELVAGSDRYSGSHHFGWKQGPLDRDTPGVIDYDVTPSAEVTWLGARHGRVSLGDPLTIYRLPERRTYSVRARVTPMPQVER